MAAAHAPPHPPRARHGHVRFSAGAASTGRRHVLRPYRPPMCTARAPNGKRSSASWSAPAPRPTTSARISSKRRGLRHHDPARADHRRNPRRLGPRLGTAVSEEALARGITTELADLSVASVPSRFCPRAAAPDLCRNGQRDAELYQGLERAGFQYHFGEDGSGIHSLLSAPRRGLLHRDRRLADDHRAPHQSAKRVRAFGRPAQGPPLRRLASSPPTSSSSPRATAR